MSLIGTAEKSADLVGAGVLEKIRAIAMREIRPRASEIDKDGLYPIDLLRRLGAVGAFAQHHAGFGDQPAIDVPAAVRAMGIVAEECLATAFCTWCQDALGWYVQNTENDALKQQFQAGVASGAILGGTGLSNPMKALSGIEPLRLTGQRVAGGYVINGVLPWVSNIEAGHYFGICFALADDPEHMLMALARCGDAGVTDRQTTRFIALDGTATKTVSFRQAFIADAMILANPLAPFARKIRPGFILLQMGMATGLIRGGVRLMRNLPAPILKVNAFLSIGPNEIEDRLAVLEGKIDALASTPTEEDTVYLDQVLKARLEGSQLSLDAAQAAMLHAGARAYIEGSVYSRRLRESYFVAIVTPAIKHLAKDIAAL